MPSGRQARAVSWTLGAERVPARELDAFLGPVPRGVHAARSNAYGTMNDRAPD
jgi:hypothetical protein